jgi:hypothetical protein
MENYRIYFENSEKDHVVRILRKYNDVVIDNIEENSVGITIERDDNGAFYSSLMEEIDRSVFHTRTESGNERLH